jgi:dipeptidyl-peptidase-4
VTTDSFPRRRAATRGFRLGAPRNIAISPDGDSLLFLRSDGPTDPVNQLWRAQWQDDTLIEEKLVDATALLAGGDEDLPAAERARRERLREVTAGITGYSADLAHRRICFVLSGQLFCHDLDSGTTTPLGSQSGLANPAIDPTGRKVAATKGGSLWLFDIDTGQESLLREPESATESWGSAEFIAAEEMGRYRGTWWAPDGESLLVQRSDDRRVPEWFIGDPAQPQQQPTMHRYPVTGSENCVVSLVLVSLTGGEIDIDWDRDSFEYLARVVWNQHGPPVIAVQNRAQTELQLREVDVATGNTQLLLTESDERWVELVAGSPLVTEHGIAHVSLDRDADARRLELLTSNGPVRTRSELHVTSLTGHDAAGLTFTGHTGDPASSDLWRMDWDGNTTRLSQGDGWATGTARAGCVVISQALADQPAAQTTSTRNGVTAKVPSSAAAAGVQPRPRFLTDNDWSRIAVLLPTEPATEPLPIIMSPYGGPHSGRSVKAGSALLTEQWLADQGFCVVVADGPGSPSTPSNEYAIYRDLASGPLAGQVTALDRVSAELADIVDPTRVGIRGWSFGGYLAALAVLERPDIFHAAVAGAPVTQWELYDTHYTERYLGKPDQNPVAYAVSDLTQRAEQLQRPLLLVHGLADDNVVAAHTLRLSTALLAAGKKHSVLPLSGVTHMTPQETIAENLLVRELDFFRQHLQ